MKKTTYMIICTIIGLIIGLSIVFIPLLFIENYLESGISLLVTTFTSIGILGGAIIALMGKYVK